MKRFIPLVMVLMIGSACNSQVRSPLEIEMYNAAGDSLGTATLSEQPDGVQIKLKLEGLTRGFMPYMSMSFRNATDLILNLPEIITILTQKNMD